MSKKISSEDLKVLEALDEQAKVQENFLKQIMWNISRGNDVLSEKKPTAVILGGQPGAGKSNILADIGEIAGKKSSEFIQINGDVYRAWHPSLKEICQIAGELHPTFTQPFVNRMVQASLDRALEEKKSFVVEGTFRTFETPHSTIMKAKDAGYSVFVGIKTCPKEVSKQRTIDRFEAEVQAGIIGARPVDPSAHDKTVAELPGNADRVLIESKPDRFLVFNDNQVLFDSFKDKGMPSPLLKAELNQNEQTFRDSNPSIKNQKQKFK